MSFPAASVIRSNGTRTADDPSSSVKSDVKMIQPAVGSPTTGPSLSARYPSVKSSASDNECMLVTSTVGRSSERCPTTERPPPVPKSRRELEVAAPREDVDRVRVHEA